MKDKYIDLIEQTFDFPQDEFTVEDNELNFHDIPLMELIKQYGTPLKITYLPKISQQINRAKRMFNVAMAKVDYKGTYNYCYCTKSSHFSFVLEEAMKNTAYGLESTTKKAFDVGNKMNKEIIFALYYNKTNDNGHGYWYSANTEVLADGGDAKIFEFELWSNGKPVDPESYIVF